jgi:hypothetical protein
MTPRRINVDDAHTQLVMASVGAMRSDVDSERTLLASARRPIQPSGQVWPLADSLVAAWEQRSQALSRWYDQLSADLGALGADLETARGMHGLAEETASGLARKDNC